MVDFKTISDNVIEGNEGKVAELTQKAINEGIEPNDIVNLHPQITNKICTIGTSYASKVASHCFTYTEKAICY